MRERLIVALDCDQHEARSLARSLEGHVTWLKVGMTLLYEAGPEIVLHLRDLGFRIFLDLKLHDIPHQVNGAAEQVARLGAEMLTVHAAGGSAMIRAACDGAARGAASAGIEPPAVIAVTVLTSMDDAMLRAVGVERTPGEQAMVLGRVAKTACASGVVCSPHEAAAMRALFGDSALVVTPGVRPSWAELGDQSRVLGPTAALEAGASHLVIGRPITAAAVPADAVERIVEEMEGACV